MFLPLQTDPILLSLGKSHKGTRRDDDLLSIAPESTRLDVRKLVLIAFRDAIIVPRVDKLRDLLSVLAASKDQVSIGVEKSDGYQRPRIQQMYVTPPLIPLDASSRWLTPL